MSIYKIYPSRKAPEKIKILVQSTIRNPIFILNFNILFLQVIIPTILLKIKTKHIYSLVSLTIASQKHANDSIICLAEKTL